VAYLRRAGSALSAASFASRSGACGCSPIRLPPAMMRQRLPGRYYARSSVSITHSISPLTTPAAAITRARSHNRRAVVGNEGVKRLPLKPAPTPARLSEVQQG
jgi:hypothetical protein